MKLTKEHWAETYTFKREKENKTYAKVAITMYKIYQDDALVIVTF